MQRAAERKLSVACNEPGDMPPFSLNHPLDPTFLMIHVSPWTISAFDPFDFQLDLSDVGGVFRFSILSSISRISLPEAKIIHDVLSDLKVRGILAHPFGSVFAIEVPSNNRSLEPPAKTGRRAVAQ